MNKFFVYQQQKEIFDYRECLWSLKKFGNWLEPNTLPHAYIIPTPYLLTCYIIIAPHLNYKI